ncbi:MAG: aspartate carbamoyltransferase [Patescibacteria group bacterium]
MINSLTTAKQLDKKTISKIFTSADKVKSKRFNKNLLQGKLMATLFYEPSTRTRLSFESAMQKLGGNVITTENAAEFSSAIKGETLEDTIRVVQSFADVIVLRHFAEGASEIAAEYSKVPIINAGDGRGEHPTQALLDLYTIFSKFPSVGTKKIRIAMVGDLANGRTVHSLSYLLTLFNQIELIYISPKALSIPESLREFLKDKKMQFTQSEKLDDALKIADVIYQTRIQKERFVSSGDGAYSESEYLHYFGKYVIDKKTLVKIKKSAVIMHPLPRVNEISPEIDSDPRAIYFEQVQNGLYIRMALLIYLFDKKS